MGKGVSTIIAVIIMLLITIALAGLAYMIITGLLTTHTGKFIELFGDIVCRSGTPGTYTISIKNAGSEVINVNELSIFIGGTGSAYLKTCTWTNTTLSPGGTTTCTIQENISPGIYALRIVGPANIITGSIACP